MTQFLQTSSRSTKFPFNTSVLIIFLDYFSGLFALATLLLNPFTCESIAQSLQILRHDYVLILHTSSECSSYLLIFSDSSLLHSSVFFNRFQSLFDPYLLLIPNSPHKLLGNFASLEFQYDQSLPTYQNQLSSWYLSPDSHILDLIPKISISAGYQQLFMITNLRLLSFGITLLSPSSPIK